MRVTLTDVSKGRDEGVLPTTTLSFQTGDAVLVCAETEQRPTVLGLLATGRMRPDTGSVEIDGVTNPGLLRTRVALIDALDVSEPDSNISVAGVVAEELMFAGRRSNPVAARRWLGRHDLSDIANRPFGTVAPSERLRILLELAVLRPGVEGFVLVSPDRHGGSPRAWWTLAREFAGRGFAVLVIAGVAAQEALGSAAAPAATRAYAAAPGAELSADKEPATESEPQLDPRPDPEETSEDVAPAPTSLADDSSDTQTGDPQ